MSCPDWQALAESRQGNEGRDPSTDAAGRDSEWRNALQHLDDCAECRCEAVSVDPLLAFRGLPGANLTSGETEEMLSRVTVLRRSRALETPAPRSRRGWVAAAVVFLAVLGGTLGVAVNGGSLAENTLATVGEPQAIDVQAAQLESFDLPTEATLAGKRSLLDDLEADDLVMPLFEEIDEEPYQQVVQWSDESISVVLVVDARFDV